MLRLLVVDDEPLVRTAIIKKLYKMKYEFTQIIQASDGNEAFQIIKDNPPDLIITDIKMPAINGIELILECEKNKIETWFIIISGYAEFEYAKAIINKGVLGYILKPIADNELRTLVDKALMQIEKSKNIEIEKKQLVKAVDINNKVLREKEINYSLTSGISYKFFSDDRYYLLAVIYLNTAFNDEIHEHLYLQKSKIIDLLESEIASDNFVFCDDYKSGKNILVIAENENIEILKKTSSEKFSDIIKLLNDRLEINSYIAVSKIEQRISREMYNDARNLLDLRLIYGYNKVSYSKDYKNQVESHLDSELLLLEKYIDENNITKAGALLKRIFSDYYFKDNFYCIYYFLFSKIQDMLLKFFENIKTKKVDESLDFLNTEVNFEDLVNLEDISNYLLSKIIYYEKMKNGEIAYGKDLILDIKKYIETHYSENVQVANIALKFIISQNYLSTIFKKEFGYSISTFIKDCRINKACELLANTDFPISDISNAVGFNDPQYFYKVFKKTVGITAMDYRKEKKINNKNPH
jgi:YesN/AraC family two-component response regulator